jgi:putative DNA primase/helicase
MTAADNAQHILDRLQKVRAYSAGKWGALCPAHDDRSPSLSIKIGREGRILLKCGAGCATEDVVARIGLTMSDLFEPDPLRSLNSVSPGGNGARCVVQTYDYLDASGNLRFQVKRYEPKGFVQCRPDGTGAFVYNMDGVERVLLNLPRVIEAVKQNEVVYVVEGEKAADALGKLGLCATCTAGGAQKSHLTPSMPDALRGAKVVVLPDNDEPGRQHGAQVVASLQGVAASVVTLALPDLPAKGDAYDWIEKGGTRAALERLVTEATREKPAPGSTVSVTLSDVEPEEVHWLLYGRVAYGKLSVLEGDPGKGKSLLAGDIAARVSRGEGLPADPRVDPADVVIASAEDGLSDTIVPRLIAAGADLARIHAITGVTGDDGQERGLVLPTDMAAVQELVEKHKAKFVYIDVLNAYLDNSFDSYRDHDIRRALLPFKNMAEATGAAVLVIRHLKKNGGGRGIASGGGSIGISGAARSVLLVDEDPNDPELRVLAVVKNNLAAPAPSLSFRVESTAAGAPRISYLGQSEETADTLAQARAARDGVGEDKTKVEEAAELLADWLGSGEVEKSKVLKMGREAGFSDSTIERAARSLKVERRGVGFREEKRSYWSLPSTLLNPVSVSRESIPDIIGGADAIGNLQGLTPPATSPQSNHVSASLPTRTDTTSQEVLI